MHEKFTTILSYLNGMTMLFDTGLFSVIAIAHSYIMCDCLISVTSILKYIKLVVTALKQLHKYMFYVIVNLRM